MGITIVYQAFTGTGGAAARSGVPGGNGSGVPSGIPSGIPSGVPSGVPSGIPSGIPSGVPSGTPSGVPSGIPSGGFYAARGVGVPRGSMQSVHRSYTVVFG